MWRRYVRALCTDAWELDAPATERLVAGIEALVVTDELTDSAVARLLHRAGVTRSSADIIAASIRVAITEARWR